MKKILALLLFYFCTLLPASAAEQARGFGASGVGSTDKIVSALTSHSTQRTYAVWFYIVGGVDRLWDKNTGTGGAEQLNFGAGDARYSRWWNTTEIAWSIPTPSVTTWHHLAITYDAGSTSNTPIFYLDGVSQTVTLVTSGPSGTVNTNSDAYVLGNRGAGDRTWNGILQHFAVWNTILTPTQIATLATTSGIYNGWAPSCYATNLAEYIKMTDSPVTSSVLANPTVTGTLQQTGLTIDYACGVAPPVTVIGGRRILP